ncbi:amidase signature domain-containing protein [Trichoderma barbatum]
MAPETITLQNNFTFRPATTAFVVIDMQQHFLNPGPRSILWEDHALRSVQKITPNIQKALEAARSMGMHIIYTREGHVDVNRPVQMTVPNDNQSMSTGDKGPTVNPSAQDQSGHDIIEELKPHLGETIIEKPGKGSFGGTGLHRLLLARGVTHLILTGVNEEDRVKIARQECNDRGYRCCVLCDCSEGFDSAASATPVDAFMEAASRQGPPEYVGYSTELIALGQTYQNAQPKPPVTAIDLDATALPSIDELRGKYRDGLLEPEAVIRSVLNRIASYERINPALWIWRPNAEDVIAAVKKLSAAYASKPLPPLFGIPFAVKDNIDVKGVVTTAACASFAYTATSTAPAIQHLLDAGAVCLGKLNLDQLATGLTGCRSPHGIPHSYHSETHITGGSSSGSAVAVAAGLVSFAVGTDTAGSVRCPAAFNGIVGFKPTKGTISARGAVPACQSLDTLGILAPSLPDARQVWYIMDRYDHLDPYAKPPSSLPTWTVDFRGPREGGFTFGIPPESLLGLCSAKYQELYKSAVKTLQSCGGKLVDIDYTPFAKAGDLIYDASLVHERLASIGHEFIAKNIDTFHPITKSIFQGVLSSDLKAWEVFRDQTTQMQCIAGARQTFNKTKGGIDVLVVPTVPWHPTIQEVLDNPLAINSKLGIFTHPANVVDLCGVSVNAGWVDDDGVRLPFGITFLGGSGYDGQVLDIAAIFEGEMK